MSLVVHELGRAQQAAVTDHFLALDAADRRLRFGLVLSDESIVKYVQGIRHGSDSLFGVYADDLTLLGVAHLASRADPAELGLSVLPAARGQGVGTLLFARAVMRARNLGLSRLFMHCLAQNDAILHIARKAGMKVTLDHGEADAWLELPPVSLGSLGQEVLENQEALLDWVVKASLAGPRALLPDVKR